MGEYSVIEDGPALIALLNPGYTYQRGPSDRIHPESPLGRYLAETSDAGVLQRSTASMEPGFGSSTAEMVAAWSQGHRTNFDPVVLLSWYRERFPRASGADLLAQSLGFQCGPGLGKSLVHVQRDQGEWVSTEQNLLEHVWVFAGPSDQKVKTHEDLEKKRGPIPREELKACTIELLNALSSGELAGLRLLSRYAELLNGVGRESEFGYNVRRRLSKIPGVFGVKGCGAALNDHFLVAVEDPGMKAHSFSIQDLGLRFMGSLKECSW